MSRRTVLTAVVAMVLVSPIAFAADEKKPDDKKGGTVENPEFKKWAKYKPGAAVVVKMTNEAGGMKTEATITRKLVEVKDDMLTMDTELSIILNGKALPTQSSPKSEVRKEMKASEFSPSQDVKSGLPAGATEDGTEKIKVGGTEYECKRYKYKTRQKIQGLGEEEVEGQVWECDDVPGRMVKMTGKSKSTTILIETIEITIKK